MDVRFYRQKCLGPAPVLPRKPQISTFTRPVSTKRSFSKKHRRFWPLTGKTSSRMPTFSRKNRHLSSKIHENNLPEAPFSRPPSRSECFAGTLCQFPKFTPVFYESFLMSCSPLSHRMRGNFGEVHHSAAKHPQIHTKTTLQTTSQLQPTLQPPLPPPEVSVLQGPSVNFRNLPLCFTSLF